MSNDELLNPIEAYNSMYKDLHKENTIKYFEELTKSTNTNVEENKKTVTEYKEKLKEIDNLKNSLVGKRGLKSFIIFCIVVLAIAGLILSVMSFGGGLPIVVGVLAIIVAIGGIAGFIVLIHKKINNEIKRLKQELAKLQEEANNLLRQAWAQMAQLNATFDWGIPGYLVNKTIPLIQMDKHFDQAKFAWLNEKYGFGDNVNLQDSTCFVQSGSILGNPFLITKDFVQSWYNKQYEGSIQITWTTSVKTSNGYRNVTHHQTLRATITRPAPRYNYTTKLIYGNDAAPDLMFTRKPSGAVNMNEKEINKFVKKRTKKLEGKARNAISKGQNYTKFGNDEFEALFGGEDRNNEVQFRLLFTPLAQSNELKLIKSKEPYGDDFYFEKEKALNYIMSKHSQTTDYSGDPTLFVDYDYEQSMKKFIDYNVNYFKAFFFDMAPLLSIPLYQQHKAVEYIYKDNLEARVSSYEHETVANSFDQSMLKHSESITPSIIKTSYVKTVGTADEVKISAYGFRGVKHVTYVNKVGGDGRVHRIPVYWIEYVPVVRDTMMAIAEKNSSRFEFNYYKNNPAFTSAMNNFAKDGAYLFERGLLASLIVRDLCADDINKVSSIYKTTEETVAKTLTKEEILDLANKYVNGNENKVYTEQNVDFDDASLLNNDSADCNEVSEEELEELKKNDVEVEEESTKEDNDSDTDDDNADDSDDKSDDESHKE